MPSRRVLQQCAIAISIISVFYNTAEGVVSVVFGAESSSRSLVFFGLQSAVEVLSAILVVWRFLSASKSDDGTGNLDKTSPKIIRIERIATITIGALLVGLTITAIATSAVSLAARDHPSTALPALLISSTTSSLMLILYLIKRYLAKALDSSTLNSEAVCALCCFQLSVVLLFGSLIYRVWKGGWWVDSATAIILGLMFGWEGIKMIRWARKESFDGGCCDRSRSESESAAASPTSSADEEKPGEPECKESCGPASSIEVCAYCKKEGQIGGEQV